MTDPVFTDLVAELRQAARVFGEIAQFHNSRRLTLAADEIERLRALLGDAIASIESWSGYASDYFKEKHDLAGELAALRRALDVSATTETK